MILCVFWQLLTYIRKFPNNMLLTTFSLLLLSYLHVLSCALDDEDEKVEEVGEGGKEDQEEGEGECQKEGEELEGV